MAKRTYNPASTACGQWEELLADALDGRLKPVDEASFAAHMIDCPACAELFEEARRGREWLAFLLPEPELPAGLLDKILAQTGPGADATIIGGVQVEQIHPAFIPASTPIWQRPGLVGSVRRFAEPRLMMTVAMAFFSIAMTLNITGVRLSDLRIANLRPNMVRSIMERRLMTASTPIIRYYDHSPLVREVQMRVRDLRPAVEGEENRPKPPLAAPGESKHAPAHQTPAETPQQSASPAVTPTLSDSDSLQAKLTFHGQPAHSGGSQKEIRERSTKWTA